MKICIEPQSLPVELTRTFSPAFFQELESFINQKVFRFTGLEYFKPTFVMYLDFSAHDDEVFFSLHKHREKKLRRELGFSIQLSSARLQNEKKQAVEYLFEVLTFAFKDIARKFRYNDDAVDFSILKNSFLVRSLQRFSMGEVG